MLELATIRDFEDALAARGIIIPEGGVVADGKLRRCDAQGRNGKGDAAYLLFPDNPPAGGFENWRDGRGWEDWRGKSNGNGRCLSPQEEREQRAKWEAARKARDEEKARNQEKAAKTARRTWEEASPAEASHPYLTRKKIGPHDLRVDGAGNIVVPMRDSSGVLWNVQRIPPDATAPKKFLYGGRVRGLYYQAGPETEPKGTIVIGEGPATVLSVLETARLPVVAAMDAGNLLAVGQELRKKFAEARLIYIADHDRPKDGHSVGIEKATEAARATGGLIAIPPRDGDDANDLYSREGADAVRGVIEAAAPVGIETDTTPGGPVTAPTEDTGTGLEPIRLTDLGNAKRLVARHGRILRYVFPWKKWLIYDGTRWKKDDSGEIFRLAKDTVAAMYVEAAQADDTEDRKRIAAHAARSESQGKLEAMIALASSEPAIPVSPTQLDADPYRFNVSNGTLDLLTGKLLPHNPEDLISKLAPVTFDPEETAQVWEAFLSRVMGGNADLIGFLQRFIGYCLSADTREQALVVALGPEATGKTTFTEAVQDVLGDYALTVQFDTFILRERDGARNDVARMQGARLVTSTEGGEGQRLNEALVKQLTGGDTVSARFLYGEFFDFRPTFKLWLATNHRPRIQETMGAIWRRLKIVPFTVQIPEAERDGRLPEKLRAELPGILNWALAGALAWRRAGLGVPEAVRQATANYREAEDTLAPFIEDRCDLGPTLRASAKDLHAAFLEWADRNGERGMSKRKFGLRLEEKGLDSFKGTGGTRYWMGIGLRSGA